jgi:hypothetical protein
MHVEINTTVAFSPYRSALSVTVGGIVGRCISVRNTLVSIDRKILLVISTRKWHQAGVGDKRKQLKLPDPQQQYRQL